MILHVHVHVCFHSYDITCTCIHIVTGKSVQHYETEEPKHGWGAEEEIGDETPSSGQSGGQEDVLCQLHRHL